MINTTEITAELLINTLSESNIKTLRRFARICDLEYQQQWSGLDLVVHARRWAAYQQQCAVVTAIDRSIAETWTNIATQLCNARLQNGSADNELIGSNLVRSLRLLTERFPSSVVHDAFVLAMLKVAREIDLSLPPHKASIRGFRAHVEAEAKLFTPTWLRTINNSSPELMQEVFRDCGMMFYPGDYFSGYFMAWRFGSEIAIRYGQVLSHSLPRHTNIELPLGSDNQLDELKIIVINSMSSSSIGSSEIWTDPMDIFVGLRGPLWAWAQWLASVFRDTPSLLKTIEQNISGEDLYVHSTVDCDNFDYLSVEDPVCYA